MKEQLKYQAHFYQFFEITMKDLRPSTISRIALNLTETKNDLGLLRVHYFYSQDLK